MNGRSMTESYNAERNRIALAGDLEPAPRNPVDRLPEADADAVSPLHSLCACVVWLEANGRKERELGWLYAQRLAALEAKVDEFLGEVGYVAPKPAAPEWDDETERHTDRHLWGI